METVEQNGCFTLFSSKFPSNIYSIFFAISSHSIQKKFTKKFQNFNALKKLGTKILAAILKTFYVSSLVLGVPINMGIGRRL